eukprot:gene13079-25419_t
MLADKNNGVVDGEDGTVEAGRRQQIKEASKEPASNAASSPIDNGDDGRTKEAVWDATRNPQFETTVCTIDKIPSQGMTKSLFESKYEGIDSSREVASRTTRAALLSKHGGLEVDLMNPSRFKKGRGAKETFTLKEYIETRM